MVKEIALGKRAKISQAQQLMLLSVMGASTVLGITLALLLHFFQQMDFNSQVIAAEEQSMTVYSNVLKSTGICKAPRGSMYSNDELAKCNPASIEVSQIPGSLRAKVLTELASNEDLSAVPKEVLAVCTNPDASSDSKKRNYTYDQLMDIYDNAVASGDAKQIASATELVESCSALRIIPDALPAFRNEEALLASLNKLFIDGNTQPDSLSPGGSSLNKNLTNNLQGLSVNVSVERDVATTMRVLTNIERSIREFNFKNARIEWATDSRGRPNLNLRASAESYYVEESTIPETTKTVKP